MEVETIFAFWI